MLYTNTCYTNTYLTLCTGIFTLHEYTFSLHTYTYLKHIRTHFFIYMAYIPNPLFFKETASVHKWPVTYTPAPQYHNRWWNTQQCNSLHHTKLSVKQSTMVHETINPCSRENQRTKIRTRTRR